MTGEWCYFKNKISVDVCEYIIKESLKLPKEEAKIGVSTSSLKVDETRKSRISFIQKNNPLFEGVFDELWKMAIQANSDFFNFHITKLDYMQFAEYDSSYNGNYKRHHDVFWMNNDPKYHRKLSCVIQLTDPNDYDGGDLEIFSDSKIDATEIRTQGTVIFFPSFMEHQANPVTRGIRYSLTSWFDGPKWR
jgi:PKHD-type hydroxylase